MVLEIFGPDRWEPVLRSDEFDDIIYHRAVSIPVIRIILDRPEVRDAFRPGTVDKLYATLDDARKRTNVGYVPLTSNDPSEKDGGWALCSGGDQSVCGGSGHEYRGNDEADASDDPLVRKAKTGRLHILEVQRLIRFMPRPTVVVAPGWTVGGGRSLHIVYDMTLASKEYAKFLQTNPDVASFNDGLGFAYLVEQVGQKKAREIFFMGKTYSVEEAVDMGMTNEVTPYEELKSVALEWANEMMKKPPTAMQILKYVFDITDDDMAGQQIFTGEATRLTYMTKKTQEDRDAFLEKRGPRFRSYPWHY